MAGEVYTRVHLTKTQFCLPAYKNATAKKLISGEKILIEGKNACAVFQGDGRNEGVNRREGNPLGACGPVDRRSRPISDPWSNALP